MMKMSPLDQGIGILFGEIRQSSTLGYLKDFTFALLEPVSKKQQNHNSAPLVWKKEKERMGEEGRRKKDGKREMMDKGIKG